MIDYTAPIYSRPDGTYVATVNGYPYHIIDGDPLKDEIEAYLAEHPEALVPEPTPPEPSAEELKKLRISEIKSKLYDIDVKTVRPARLVALGRATQEDLDKLNTLEDEAEALRIELRGLLQ